MCVCICMCVYVYITCYCYILLSFSSGSSPLSNMIIGSAIINGITIIMPISTRHIMLYLIGFDYRNDQVHVVTMVTMILPPMGSGIPGSGFDPPGSKRDPGVGPPSWLERVHRAGDKSPWTFGPLPDLWGP